MTSIATKATATRVHSSPKPTDAIIPTAAILLTAAFFATHQAWSTGFFQPSFTPLQAALFYSSILYGIVVTSTGAFKIRQDQTLVLDLIGGVLWTITAIWLYFAFPFDFTHLAAVVPWPLTFIVTWITNGVAKTIGLLIVIGSAAFIPFFAVQLSTARRRLQERER
jgi:hypothetical protein